MARQQTAVTEMFVDEQKQFFSNGAMSEGCCMNVREAINRVFTCKHDRMFNPIMQENRFLVTLYNKQYADGKWRVTAVYLTNFNGYLMVQEVAHFGGSWAFLSRSE